MIFLNLCFIISNSQKNNKKSINIKKSKKRPKRKYNKSKKSKYKLRMILFTKIIFLKEVAIYS